MNEHLLAVIAIISAPETMALGGVGFTGFGWYVIKKLSNIERKVSAIQAVILNCIPGAQLPDEQ